jgi:hypothetical protein
MDSGLVLRTPRNDVEQKFLFGFNLMLPVQSPLQKYSGSLLTQITSTSRASPPNTEGRFAIVTNVGLGMRWTRVALLTKAFLADGEVVWS